MYAIFQKNGHQYKASPGEKLKIDQLSQEEGETFGLSEILLFVKDGEVEIGTPYLKDAKITFRMIRRLKGEKIRVARFKAKSRYTKIKGFRPNLSEILVESIKIGSQEYKNKAKTEKETKKAKKA